MDEPVRMVQTNIPIHMWEDLTAQELIENVEKHHANTWLFNIGGIYANYPTALPYQTRNPYLSKESDIIQEIVDLAQEKEIRLMARFDFSRFAESIAKDYPKGCFRKENGDVITYNGLVTSCINGEYYRNYSMKMVEEFLQKYPFKGVFINWWGNHIRNGYSGILNGVCHCDGCQKFWQEYSDQPFPQNPKDSNYRAFLQKSKAEVAALMRKHIKKVAPDIPFLLYHGSNLFESLDGFTVESKTNYTPNIWWQYQSSYYINGFRNSYPEKMPFNTVVNFINFKYRHEPHRTSVNQTRMLQSMAHGAFPSLYMVGPLVEDFNKQASDAITFPLEWHAEHEAYLTKQRSAANIGVIAEGFATEDIRGLISLLSELHLPHRVFNKQKHFLNTEAIDVLISVPSVTSEVLHKAEGMNHLMIGAKEPLIFKNKTKRKWKAADTLSCYWKVKDKTLFPKLSKVTDLVYLESEYLEVEKNTLYEDRLMMVPPGIHSPTEITYLDQKVSNLPGLIMEKVEKGEPMRMWLPWHPTSMYHQRAGDNIRLLFEDLMNHLLDGKPQIITDAHPLVEIAWMKQPEEKRHLLHMINLSSQLHGSGGQWIPMRNIDFKIKGEYQRAFLVDGNIKFPITQKDGYVQVKVPQLGQYDILVLE